MTWERKGEAADELLYLPRNARAHKLYGMSPVEHIALTINIALRRDAATFEYYRAGSLPNAFGTVTKEWTPDQIRDFENNYDAKMSGNLHRRGMLKFHAPSGDAGRPRAAEDLDQEPARPGHPGVHGRERTSNASHVATTRCGATHPKPRFSGRENKKRTFS